MIFELEREESTNTHNKMGTQPFVIESSLVAPYTTYIVIFLLYFCYFFHLNVRSQANWMKEI